MHWTEPLFDGVLLELIDENPLAVRPVMKLLGRRFTREVPTLAVTLTDPPELLINPEFVTAHCRTEEQLKAALFHEFLHIVLGHTMRFGSMSPLQNLALDAVINAIIHRQCGPDYSSLFSEYYADQEGIGRMLRPRSEQECQDLYARFRARMEELREDLDDDSCDVRTPMERAWMALYDGRIVSDDILELAESFGGEGWGGLRGGRHLIGGHEGPPIDVAPPALKEALEESLRQMNGSGIWRSPGAKAGSTTQYRPQCAAADARLERWRAQTLKVLRKALLPDPKCRLAEIRESSYRLPVLSPKDRRAFLRAAWSPFLPEAENAAYRHAPLGSASVYLDVSGSMDAEMPLIVSLLHQVRRAIRMPFWAFSDVVSPATIEGGRLTTASTGGTSMSCVLKHLAKTKPPCAIVVTDGYIEPIDQALLAACRDIRLTAIVTRDGDPSLIQAARIPYLQLEKIPHG